MLHRARLLGLIGLSSLIAGAAEAQGISARFVPLDAVEGGALVVEVEVEDPIGVVGAVRLLFAVEAGDPIPIEARRDPDSGRWVARVDADKIPPAGRRVVLRAEILGRRGGLLSELGGDEPLELVVLTRAEGARAEARFAEAEQVAAGGYLVGDVGLDARAGAASRLRGLVGAHVRLEGEVELAVIVTVGPVFSPPLPTSGPLTLGFEIGPRIYRESPLVAPFALFIEPAALVDLRLPELDLGVGLRAGVTVRLGGPVSLDVGLGGGAFVSAVGAASIDLAFHGGGRVGLRFDGLMDEGGPR